MLAVVAMGVTATAVAMAGVRRSGSAPHRNQPQAPAEPAAARLPERAVERRPPGRTPALELWSTNRSDALSVRPFDVDGWPRPAALGAINHFFRSSQGTETAIDPRLVELLTTLSLAFDHRPLTLISGYRQPGRGTRKSSYHAHGMAADIAIAGVSPRELQRAAVRLGATGAGLYPRFVHVDVRNDRPPYQWTGR